MNVRVFDSKAQLGAAAAQVGAAQIRAAIAEKDEANIVVATGVSQFEVLSSLVAEADIDWSKVTGFHLDEYIGIPETHPASFRGYLKARFTAHIPTLKAFHFVHGDAADLSQEVARLNALIEQHPVDIAFAGIGENGHLAFNDPPANFDASGAFEVVDLDEACRQQQYGEGWFPSLDAVPRQAVTMTIPQILKSKLVVISASDERKATAVRGTLEGPVSNLCPASILQIHPNCRMFVDVAATSLLARRPMVHASVR